MLRRDYHPSCGVLPAPILEIEGNCMKLQVQQLFQTKSVLKCLRVYQHPWFQVFFNVSCDRRPGDLCKTSPASPLFSGAVGVHPGEAGPRFGGGNPETRSHISTLWATSHPEQHLIYAEVRRMPTRRERTPRKSASAAPRRSPSTMPMWDSM